MKLPKAFLDLKVQPLMEFDWHTYLCNKRKVGIFRHYIVLKYIFLDVEGPQKTENNYYYFTIMIQFFPFY